MRVSAAFALLAGALALSAAAAADAQPPEGWADYAPRDKVFSVWVPKGGKRTERTATVDVKGLRVRVNLLELQTEGKGRLSARTYLLPRPVAPRPKAGKPAPFPDPGALTEAVRDGFLKEVKGKVADEKEVKVGDVTGKEYLVKINDKAAARLRVFVMGLFIFEVSIAGTPEQVGGKDADTFLESFKPTV
jgi:hypothetical protein